ncbi:MAG: HD domain-containing protein [Xanthomonadaceae bacterium]|nr:HD domain-containing protein [Rhodospirillaceae bacterium]NIA17736.1 HD domain-containing protein [Xanthomonadaceae bacterium]
MKIPKYVQNTIKSIEKAGFEAYIVGGCVRDLLMEKTPKDWDITTNAIPKEILKIFPDSVYENKFGTVGVKIKEKDKIIDIIEITTYRIESKYSDKRRPDKVRFTNSLEKDLSRRDFTINTMALRVKSSHNKQDRRKSVKSKIYKIKSYDVIDIFNGQKDFENSIIDPFNGKKDLKNKIIRAVSKPDERFSEDALRMMRAVRFAVVLNFEIEPKTFKAIQKNAYLIKKIANERIRDEFIGILKSDHPDLGITLLKNLGILHYIIPELELGVGMKQNKHHIYTIFKHLILSLKYCPSNDYRVRLAALFHDIAKPQTKKGSGKGATFYNHDIVGAKISAKIMKRLAFSNEDIEKVTNLIKNHMFYYNVDEVSEAGVRRLVKKVGLENMKDLMDLRIADRLGSGVPKAKPYKLRHLEYLIDKVSKDPISVKMLKINGNDLIKKLKIEPGPKIGTILDCLLAEIIENPKNNIKKYLEKRAKVLNQLELKQLRKKAKLKIEERKEEENKEIKQKHWVK